MGHYSQDYEHTAKAAATEKRKRLKKVQAQLQKLAELTEEECDKEVPQRFFEAMADFNNFLTVSIGTLK